MRRLVGNDHDALDVLQETYLRAYRAIGRFRGESSVRTWLYRIAANCATSELRRRPRHRTEQLDVGHVVVEPSCQLDPESAAFASEDRERLSRALDRLPASLRSVVVLYDIYGLGHEAIAAELNISRSATKVRLHRARRRLRAELFPPRHELTRPVGERPVVQLPRPGAPASAKEPRRGADHAASDALSL